MLVPRLLDRVQRWNADRGVDAIYGYAIGAGLAMATAGGVAFAAGASSTGERVSASAASMRPRSAFH